jgi:RIO-like serine/threonine protein kinase
MKLEVECLNRLKGYKHFPQIISVTGQSIKMSYCGTSIKKDNRVVEVPDQASQVKRICATLKERGIVHLDIKRLRSIHTGVVTPNICVTDEGVINLIDFNNAVIDGNPIDEELAEKLKKFKGWKVFEQTMIKNLNNCRWIVI